MPVMEGTRAVFVASLSTRTPESRESRVQGLRRNPWSGDAVGFLSTMASLAADGEAPAGDATVVVEAAAAAAALEVRPAKERAHLPRWGAVYHQACLVREACGPR